MKQLFLLLLVLCGYDAFSQETHRIVVAVNQADCTITGIDKPAINIYPNPSSKILVIDAGEAINSIDLVDLGGQLLVSKKAEGAARIEFDISTLEKGLYSCILKFDGRTSVHKVILK